MISLISSLSLKLYLNSLVYHRNIFGSSSKVFGNLRKSSDVFGNFRKMFGNVRLAFGTILENLRKSSVGGRKSSENHQKRRHQHVYIIKRTLHGGLKINLLLTEREGRTGEYWPEVVAVRTERSEVRTKRRRANISRYGSS